MILGLFESQLRVFTEHKTSSRPYQGGYRDFIKAPLPPANGYRTIAVFHGRRLLSLLLCAFPTAARQSTPAILLYISKENCSFSLHATLTIHWVNYIRSRMDFS